MALNDKILCIKIENDAMLDSMVNMRVIGGIGDFPHELQTSLIAFLQTLKLAEQYSHRRHLTVLY